MDEEQTIQRASKGDQEAFGELFEKYERFVYNVAYRMMGEQGEAEELAQEVFVTVWRKLPSFRGACQFSTWLYRITVNQTLNRIKRDKRLLPLLNEERLVANTEGPSERLERQQAHEELNALLAQIAPERRMVIVLREIEGLAYEEVAETLNIPLGTVRSRLNRGRKELESIATKERENEN